MLDLVLFVAFFVLLALLGLLVFRRMRRRVQQEQAKVDTLGFPVVQDPAFATRLAAHFRANESDRPFVGRLMKRAGPGGTIWLCQLRWADEEWPAAVVLESDRLALPRFLLFPEKSGPTVAGVLEPNRHLHHLMAYDDSTRDFAPIRLDGTPHTLSGPKAVATERRFTPAFRAWLRETEGLALSGEGNLLVVWPTWPMSLAWGPALEPDVATCVARAETCRGHLRS